MTDRERFISIVTGALYSLEGFEIDYYPDGMVCSVDRKDIESFVDKYMSFYNIKEQKSN